MPTQIKPWDLVAGYLRHIGVSTVFGIPSDDLYFPKALRLQGLRVLVAKDQRNALFMTAAYAKVGRRLGVCAVGKGPALTNTVTGLLEALALSAPVLLVALGTAQRAVGTGAFQETDQLRLVKPLVKWAYRVEHGDRLAWALEKAVFMSTNGCPGPVYLELPEDLSRKCLPSPARPASPSLLQVVASEGQLDEARHILEVAHRPVLLAGGGAAGSPAGLIEELAERLEAAIFVTASGRGAVDESHPLYCGLAGLYTAVPLRELWKGADAIVVLGSRMEETATMLLDPSSKAQQTIQVNLCIDHFSHLYQGVRLWGDCSFAARHWLQRLDKPEGEASEWHQRITRLKHVCRQRRDDLRREATNSCSVQVTEVLSALENTLPKDAILVQENGLLDMWSYFYPHFSLTPEQVSLVPSEQTTLGFGAAAAIGAKVAMPRRTVVALVGDGAFNMFKADLATTIDGSCPITYIILNNGGFGWLEYQATGRGLDRSMFRFSFSTRAATEGIVCIEITAKGQIEDALRRAYQHNEVGQTALIDVPIKTLEVAPGVGELVGPH